MKFLKREVLRISNHIQLLKIVIIYYISLYNISKRQIKGLVLMNKTNYRKIQIVENSGLNQSWKKLQVKEFQKYVEARLVFYYIKNKILNVFCISRKRGEVASYEWVTSIRHHLLERKGSFWEKKHNWGAISIKL